jgi:hypothetical protein
MLLEELANDALSKLRAFTPHEQFRNSVTRVTAEQLPYDIVTGDCRNVAELLELNGAELHVDYKPRQLESFEEWVDERVLEMTGNWASVKFPYDQEDVVTLRKFFTLNSGLPDETLLDLWRESDEVVTGDISGNPIKPRKGSFDTRYFARNSRTGRAFLKNLPKIVMQKYFDYEEEITEDEFRRRADREHYLLNYDYLERPPTGSFVPPCFAMLPVVEIDDDDDESCIQFPTMTT